MEVFMTETCMPKEVVRLKVMARLYACQLRGSWVCSQGKFVWLRSLKILQSQCKSITLKQLINTGEQGLNCESALIWPLAL